jgi:2'-5' RNA ligase
MRLFLAAELPEPVRRSLIELQAELKGRLRGWRWVRAEGIHLTLRFLGEVDAGLDARARSAWERVARDGAPFRIRLTRPGRFPQRGAPRVLWVGLEEIEPGEALAGLAAGLERNARELGWQAEERPFRPHLTLARRQRGARPDGPPEEVRAVGAEGWVRRIVLFRSRLDRSGARYTALASFALGGLDEGPERAGRPRMPGREGA